MDNNSNKNNYYRTRDMCEDISKTLNMTNSGVHNFLRIIELALIHKIVEEYNSEVEVDKVLISIPFICDLELEVKNNDVSVNNIVLENKFKTHVIEAIRDKKSPLEIEAEKSLINRIKKKYNSII